MKSSKIVLAVALSMVGTVTMAQWIGVPYSNPDGDWVQQLDARIRNIAADCDREMARLQEQQRQQEEARRIQEEDEEESEQTESSESVQTSGGGSIQGMISLLNRTLTMRKAGNWREAIEAESQLVNCDDQAAGNVASYYVDLFFLHWNLDEKCEAKDCLRKGIRLMRNSNLLGGGCEARAEALLTKAEADEIGDRFSVNDLESPLGIERYVTQPVYDRFNQRVDASINRSRAMGSYFSSRSQGYRLEGEGEARLAKLVAGEAYQKATGYKFDPDDRPAYSGELSDKWLACKRIYDIFGE